MPFPFCLIHRRAADASIKYPRVCIISANGLVRRPAASAAPRERFGSWLLHLLVRGHAQAYGQICPIRVGWDLTGLHLRPENGYMGSNRVKDPVMRGDPMAAEGPRDKQVRAVDRLLDDRVRQGLPRTITDPAVLARVASIVRAAHRRSAA